MNSHQAEILVVLLLVIVMAVGMIQIHGQPTPLRANYTIIRLTDSCQYITIGAGSYAHYGLCDNPKHRAGFDSLRTVIVRMKNSFDSARVVEHMNTIKITEMYDQIATDKNYDPNN